MVELKPCPVCGCPAKILYGFDGYFRWIKALCCNCGNETKEFHYLGIEEQNLAEEVIAVRWNRRRADDA